MNYLGKIGWSKPEIEVFLKSWNAKNKEPLREVYIKGQPHSFKAGDKLPPNCNNEAYYKGMGICKYGQFLSAHQESGELYPSQMETAPAGSGRKSVEEAESQNDEEKSTENIAGFA